MADYGRLPATYAEACQKATWLSGQGRTEDAVAMWKDFYYSPEPRHGTRYEPSRVKAAELDRKHRPERVLGQVGVDWKGKQL